MFECTQAFDTPNRGYIQVFEYAQAFGSPIRATYRRLDPKLRLRTGVWSLNQGYTWVFGVPNCGYTRVFGVPIGRSCKLPLTAGNLRRGPNLEILKNQDCRHFENWSLPMFKMSGHLGSVFKTFGKFDSNFSNVLKTDPNFPDILKMGQAPVFKMSTILVFQNFKVWSPMQVPSGVLC